MTLCADVCAALALTAVHSQHSGNAEPSQLIAFAKKTLVNGVPDAKLHIIELGAKPGAVPFAKKSADVFFPPEIFADDFPVAMQVSEKYGLVYVITKLGLLFIYDLESGTAVYRNRISQDSVFLTVDSPSTGGFYAINRTGKVLLVDVNTQALVPFISTTLQNLDLALAVAQRGNLPGAEALVLPKFEALFSAGNYGAAAEAAADSPQGVLRTPETIAKFASVAAPPGTASPLLQYFGTCLKRGKLNAYESFELAKLVLGQNKKQLLDGWLGEDKLECSEELGDLVYPVDAELALKVYVKGRVSVKAATALAARGEMDKFAAFCEQTGYVPDYADLMARMLALNPTAAVSLACHIVSKNAAALDVNTLTDYFLTSRPPMVREATQFLLEVLKPNLPEHAALQTKVLEMNLLTFPNVADAILANNMFSHYDKPRIAQLCEKAGLYARALQHYTELSDIKRVVINTHAIEPAALVEFFGSLSRDWALECMRELLAVNMRQNLQLVVQVAKEYTEQLSAEKVIEVLESFKSWEGLFFYLGAFIAQSEDPEVHFKYIEAATRTGQVKEVERVTRESNFYDPERTKVFLMETKLPDARPLINVCDRFDGTAPQHETMVHDLTIYLLHNNMMRYIEGYVQKVNPQKTPQVVGALLDAEADEAFIKTLILSVRSLLPVAPLVEEVEKRNRLKMLHPFLEHLMNEGSTDPAVHNAMGKVFIDSNNNPEHFLLTNQHYEPLVLGRYCEKRDPNLACVAYKKGRCDFEYVDVTSRNSLFKQQARYVVERMDAPLWAHVLREDNDHRKQLIDQVVSTALPESKNPEQVSVTVKAFMTAGLPHELIELLEKIVLQNSAFSNNPSLQNLLILTAIKSDPGRVMDYVNRLDHFDGPSVGELAVTSELFEEAFAIFRKFDNHLAAARVLIDNLKDMKRATEYAAKVEIPEVWSALGRAQLREQAVGDAIASFIKAKDSNDYVLVIDAAHAVGAYADLVIYLRMVRKRVKEVARVDTELVYSLAFTNALAELEEFIAGSNAANLTSVGDRCFAEERYDAAKLLFTQTSNWGRLASTLVKLHQFQPAVDAAKRANAVRTWKEVCFSCVEEKEFRLAQLCGLHIIVQADELESVTDFYTSRGYFDECIALLEAGVGLERSHMGIFTELGILYAKFRAEKLAEHLKLFATRINIPKLIRVCEAQAHWRELATLYIQYDEYDNAAQTMMLHADAWEHVQFKDTCVKVANAEIYYKAATFYLEEHPQLLNDLLQVLTPRLDHGRVVSEMRKSGHLAMIKEYMQHVQKSNLQAVNEALHELYTEEEDLAALRESVDMYDNFDQIGLALRFKAHELIEFRRLASHLFKRNARWKDSIELSKADGCFKDAMETAAQSGDRALAEELLTYFVDQKLTDCFAAQLYACYDLLRPDAVLELAWTRGVIDFAFPFFIQAVREYTTKVDKMLTEAQEHKVAAESEAKEAKEAHAAHNMYNSLMPPALPAPADWVAANPAAYAHYDPYAAQQGAAYGGAGQQVAVYGQGGYGHPAQGGYGGGF